MKHGSKSVWANHALVLWTILLTGGTMRGASVDYVVQVSLDGLGGIYLESYVQNAPDQFPNFLRLMNAGAYTFNARCDYDYSETVPNHITMFTARPVSQPNGLPDTVHHGYSNNFPGLNDTIHANGNPGVPYKASMFDVAHDFGLTTAFHASKTRLLICDRSYNEFNGALDLIGDDNGQDKIDAAYVTDTSGENITNEVNVLIEDLLGAEPTRYSFMHLAEPDLTGHGASWGSEAWSNIVRVVDGQLGRILDAIETQPNLRGNTALIVTADHGGGGVTPNSHNQPYHILNYTIPFFVMAPGVPGGTDLYSLMNNRGDPGTNRTDYTTVPQPIRDGDASNLALALLGLPPIPDSFMIPELQGAGAVLTATLLDDDVEIAWIDPSNVYVLEQSGTVPSSISWSKVSGAIGENGIRRSYRFARADGPDATFFRLRRIAFSLSSQPASQTVHAGTSAQFSVGALSDKELHYQWYHEGNLLEGATGPQLVLATVGASDAGTYQVEVSDDFDAVFSSVATLNVLFAPVITQQPQSQIVSQDATAVFAVQAEGAEPLAYQWSKDGMELLNETSDQLTISNVTTAAQGAYTVVVTDQNGSVTSEPATLGVTVPLAIVMQPQNVTNQIGSTVTFTVTIEGSPPPFTYVWRKFPSTIIATIDTDERTSTLTLTDIDSSDAGSYLVNISNVINPTGVTSFPVARLVVTQP